jgi:hypothetical protein
MAHTVVKNPNARVIEQCAQGRRIRNIVCKGISIAQDRSSNVAPGRIMATVIKSETEIIPIFTAPCKCKVVRVYANGTPYADMASGGSVTAKMTKAVIGTSDVDLCSTIAIGAATVPTLDTAIDAVLSTTSGALDLLEGQNVYATIAVSAHNVDTAVAYVTLALEWIPMDNP